MDSMYASPFEIASETLPLSLMGTTPAAVMISTGPRADKYPMTFFPEAFSSLALDPYWV